MKYNSSNFKNDLDQYIGISPLTKNEDMQRFNEWLLNQDGKKIKKWLFPQIVTGFLVLLFLSISFILIKSSLFEKDFNMTSPGDKENMIAIETVLKHQFTGPDMKLIALLKSPENTTIIGKDVESSKSERPTELDLYLEELYQPYFTENMYKKYVSAFALNYQTTAEGSGYQIKVDTIDIKAKTEDAYDFKVSVIYHKKNGGNKQNTAKVTGKVYIYEKGKIAGFKLLDDGGLLKALKTGK